MPAVEEGIPFPVSRYGATPRPQPMQQHLIKQQQKQQNPDPVKLSQKILGLQKHNIPGCIGLNSPGTVNQNIPGLVS